MGSDREPPDAGEPYVPPDALATAAYEGRRPADLAGQAPDEGLRVEGRRLAEPEATEQRLQSLTAQVESLEAQVRSARRPWFREASSLVAVLALLFSFGTTVVSLNRTAQQDQHDKKVELLSLIDRLSGITRDFADARTQYADNPAVFATLSSVLNQQQLLAAEQAANIMAQIPNDVSAAEYSFVASVLLSNSIDEIGATLLQQAVRVSTNANDLVGALRTIAIRSFQIGQVDEGRTNYRLAMDVFSRFPSRSAYYVAGTHLQTQVSWATAELGVNQCDEAKVHVEAARTFAAQVSSTENLVLQLQELEPLVAACVPGPLPSPAASALPSLAPAAS